jgi:D-sedoheptulose 7-phosphate isomerase
MSINAYLEEIRKNIEFTILSGIEESFERAVEICISAIESNKLILVAGNGGSMSDAMHLSGELVNWFKHEHKGLAVITLGVNPSVSSAWSNDYSFEDQLRREFEALQENAGALIVFTTSGKSKNINNLLNFAKEKQVPIVIFTATRAQENLLDFIDSTIMVPVSNTPGIQEIHIGIYHHLCEEIERRITGN